jgi:dihydroxy-acid dehydratase
MGKHKKLFPLRYNSIGVSDGITMGTPGMRYSLPSRELIAWSIESMVNAHYYDGNISVVGCDKNMPGAVIKEKLLILFQHFKLVVN